MDKFRDLTNPKSLRSRIRRRRTKNLISLINYILQNEELTTINICDLGGTYRYWLIFPFENFSEINFNITLVNLEKIMSSEVEKYKELINATNVNFIEEIGNGCDMKDKSDNTYHLSHSNSVIEHVGSWSNIKDFAKESTRIAYYHYLQTPNYWFPIEPHYFLPLVHFFPRPIHTRLIMKFKKRSFDNATSNFEENRMLSKKELKFLFPDSYIKPEWFLIFIKSYVLIPKVS